MQKRVLHILSQRPARTGSGVTLEALVREAASRGWEQHAVVGVPAEDPSPEVGGLDAGHVHPLRFGGPDLPFALPGMSDVMPYPSSRFSALSSSQIQQYRRSWKEHLGPIVQRTAPSLIHVHHLWIVASLIKEIAPNIPVVNHCHATGLRQLQLCPNLSAPLCAALRKNDRFLALHQADQARICETLGVSAERVSVIGAGYRQDLFNTATSGTERSAAVLYAGKLSASKGLPWLLDAVELVAKDRPELVLHVAGAGSGEEADQIRSRMAAMSPRVVAHGHVDQRTLAQLMRQSAVFVLPSFYEGLPLVLVEALASGCRLVATSLPGVTEELAPHVGDALAQVPLPRLQTIDRPVSEDLPRFVKALERALNSSLARGPLTTSQNLPQRLEPFTWSAVFERVQGVWDAMLPP